MHRAFCYELFLKRSWLVLTPGDAGLYLFYKSESRGSGLSIMSKSSLIFVTEMNTVAKAAWGRKSLFSLLSPSLLANLDSRAATQVVTSTVKQRDGRVSACGQLGLSTLTQLGISWSGTGPAAVKIGLFLSVKIIPHRPS